VADEQEFHGGRGTLPAAAAGHAGRQVSVGGAALATVTRVEVLASRVLLRPSDFDAGRHWYRDVLGLRVSREYGAGGHVTGVVFFLGGGFLELVSGASPVADPAGAALWLQVHDVDAEHARLAAAGVEVLRGPVDEPWGLRECWVADPDGVRIALIEIPDTHPLRRRVD
jgi:catechol 2,3-dioxygenase-like lactoylglutathione lyase family enzyme